MMKQSKKVLIFLGGQVVPRTLTALPNLHTQMKKIISILLFTLISTSLYSQNSNIKVSYDYHFFTSRGYEVNRPMILTFSNVRSKFFNPDTNRIDSICNTPEGKAELEAYVNSVNGREIILMIILPDGKKCMLRKTGEEMK